MCQLRCYGYFALLLLSNLKTIMTYQDSSFPYIYIILNTPVHILLLLATFMLECVLNCDIFQGEKTAVARCRKVTLAVVYVMLKNREHVGPVMYHRDTRIHEVHL